MGDIVRVTATQKAVGDNGEKRKNRNQLDEQVG